MLTCLLMEKLSRILSNVVAILFVLIGILHTDVHFRELASIEVKSRLSIIHDISLLREQADIWKLWQGFSFMMGVGFIIIGMLRLLGIQTQNVRKEVMGAATMHLLLIVVIFSGILFFAPPQIYGGVIGLILQFVSVALLIRSRQTNKASPRWLFTLLKRSKTH